MDFNATFASQIVALKFVNFRQVGIVLSQAFPTLYNGTLSYMEAPLSGDGMTTSPVDLLTSACDLTGCFMQVFAILSHSMQIKAVITVRYHVKVMKTTRELDY
jgi:hypothetical protein